jgi:ferritin
MFEQNTYEAFNGLMNHMFQVAEEYFAMETAAMVTGSLDGFASMLRNEGHERWHLGRCFRDYIVKHGGNPAFDDIQKPRQEFASPVEMLNYAMSLEDQTRDAIHAAAITARDNAPVFLKKIGYYGEMVSDEHREISKLHKKLTMAGANLQAIDSWLMKEYEEHNPCGRYK